MLIVLFGVTLLTFVLSHVIPADPIRAAAGPYARSDQIEKLRKEFGMDKPLTIQYLSYLQRLAHGDLGISIHTRRPVLNDLLHFFPATLEVTIIAAFLMLAIGIPLGVVSATHENHFLDNLSRLFSLAGVSSPMFWVALLLQLLFFAKLHLLPADGRLDLLTPVPPTFTGMYTIDSLLAGQLSAFYEALRHIILPSVTLAYGSLAVLTRVVRSSMLEVLHKDYIRTARSKGVSEKRVIYRHAFRNSLISTVTLLGMQVASLLGGVFVVEVVFSWPGIGFYAVRAILAMDFPAIMGVTLLATFIFTAANLIVDLLYPFLDPRIVYG